MTPVSHQFWAGVFVGCFIGPIALALVLGLLARWWPRRVRKDELTGTRIKVEAVGCSSVDRGRVADHLNQAAGRIRYHVEVPQRIGSANFELLERSVPDSSKWRPGSEC